MKTEERLRRLGDIYGPWALVAGASEGLGAAFSRLLASIGFRLVLVARREELLDSLARDLGRDFGTELRPIAGDLSRRSTLEAVRGVVEEVAPGLLVYNAAFAPRGAFAGADFGDLETAIRVNVQGPVELIHRLLPVFARRRAGGARAGVILMSSLAGDQGSPGVATYAATKAFNTVLAQGLWHELRPAGIDVAACIAGAVRTPGLAAARGYRDAGSRPGEGGATTGSAGQAGDGKGAAPVRPGAAEAPGTLDPEVVARAALSALGRRPIVVPGAVNKLARFLMRRLLPARTAIGIMASSTKGLIEPGPAKPENNTDGVQQ